MEGRGVGGMENVATPHHAFLFIDPSQYFFFFFFLLTPPILSFLTPFKIANGIAVIVISKYQAAS